MEEEVEKKRKGSLKLGSQDWEKLLDGTDEEEEPAELHIGTTASADKPKVSATPDDRQAEKVAYFARFSDRDLEEKIRRVKITIDTLCRTLPDNGLKIRQSLQEMEDERKRRKGLKQETDVCESPAWSRSSSTVGTQVCLADCSEGFRKENAPLLSQLKSTFATCFCEKIAEDTGSRSPDDKQMSSLVPCHNLKIKNTEKFSPRGRHRSKLSTRHRPLKGPSNLSSCGDKGVHANHAQKRIASSAYSFYHVGESLDFTTKGRDAAQVWNPHNLRPRKGKTVVLLDEEEPLPIAMKQHDEKLSLHMKNTKIYYPSRDDPEAVEISYEDSACLAPQVYLTSNIMNFYIRYLQQQSSPTNSAICDCHFFNTYFYKKLKEAVAYKGDDKDKCFAKFRRWWKGVHIFQKAYVLIPIHEDLHWSLVIICIPDEEEESGPIILHLDSLGLHSSRSIFQNIRSFLKDEWKYLNHEGTHSDCPIVESMWNQLPHRIMPRIIQVPQQKNEYDCGLFVLYFMERFIEGAPERLKSKDLAMFGKQWFKPEEASALRSKIQYLLKKEFHNACEIDKSESSSPSSISGVSEQ